MQQSLTKDKDKIRGRSHCMEVANLNSFLTFGYFLDYKSPYRQYIDFSHVDKSLYAHLPEEELIKIGSRLFKKAIVKQFDPSSINVVSLSGGLDSRALLAGLLECTEVRNIHTYTYGTPGTMDYEIGNSIAKKTGTRHERFPLTKIQYNFGELLATSKRMEHQTILFHTPPVSMVDLLYRGAFIWTGVVIDVFFGRHTHLAKAASIDEAKENSIRENVYTRSAKLTNVENSQYFQLIDYDHTSDSVLLKEHIIDLINRQLKFVAPAVLLKGSKYKALFTDKELTQFSLNIDNRYLENQTLYKKILLNSFPKLFRYGTKTNRGLPLSANRVHLKVHNFRQRIGQGLRHVLPLTANPYTNFLDFNKGIRCRYDLQKIIYTNIMDLKDRGFVDWIDIPQIWHRHMHKIANHADALIALTSLEIHLKAGKTL